MEPLYQRGSEWTTAMRGVSSHYGVLCELGVTQAEQPAARCWYERRKQGEMLSNLWKAKTRRLSYCRLSEIQRQIVVPMCCYHAAISDEPVMAGVSSFKNIHSKVAHEPSNESDIILHAS